MHTQHDKEARKEVAIRVARSEDAPAIEELMVELGYQASHRLVTDRLRQFATSQYDEAFVAVESASLVGCISVHVLELFHEAGRLGRITSLVVGRNARGKRVGRALLEQADRFFTSLGCIRAEVNSGDHRGEAHRFYVRNGYAEDERRFVKRF
jgi:GNAT superfamily N-acetyltransferase